MKVPTLPMLKYKPENFDTAEELIARAKEIAVRQHECRYQEIHGGALTSPTRQPWRR